MSRKIRRSIGKITSRYTVIRGGSTGSSTGLKRNHGTQILGQSKKQVLIGPVFNGKPMRLIESSSGKVQDSILFCRGTGFGAQEERGS
ncbi:hypothetical protein [Cohnella lupini]|nr:hypothetical protein [Cohnella lupini]